MRACFAVSPRAIALRRGQSCQKEVLSLSEMKTEFQRFLLCCSFEIFHNHSKYLVESSCGNQTHSSLRVHWPSYYITAQSRCGQALWMVPWPDCKKFSSAKPRVKAVSLWCTHLLWLIIWILWIYTYTYIYIHIYIYIYVYMNLVATKWRHWRPPPSILLDRMSDIRLLHRLRQSNQQRLLRPACVF